MGRAGPAFTLKINNVVEACGGIAMLDSSMGDCWQLVPHSDHGIVVYRSVLRKFVELMRDYEFRRLQAYIVVGFKDAERMAGKLGFKYEGTLINLLCQRGIYESVCEDVLMTLAVVGYVIEAVVAVATVASAISSAKAQKKSR